MCEVYKIENKINGKKYIGITIQGARTRFLHHLYESRSGSTFPLHRSINKYGKENFTIETIETCDSTEQMKEREKFWISFYNTIDRSLGYNRTTGGDGTFGRLHSEETKDKIRQKAIGRKASSGTKERMSESGKGRKMSENTRRALDIRNQKSKKAIIQYDMNMNFIAEFESIMDADRKTGVHYTSIIYRLKHPPKITSTNRYGVKFIWKLKE
jgi:group I intron endonuclease